MGGTSLRYLMPVMDYQIILSNPLSEWLRQYPIYSYAHDYTATPWQVILKHLRIVTESKWAWVAQPRLFLERLAYQPLWRYYWYSLSRLASQLLVMWFFDFGVWVNRLGITVNLWDFPFRWCGSLTYAGSQWYPSRSQSPRALIRAIPDFSSFQDYNDNEQVYPLSDSDGFHYPDITWRTLFRRSPCFGSVEVIAVRLSVIFEECDELSPRHILLRLSVSIALKYTLDDSAFLQIPLHSVTTNVLYYAGVLTFPDECHVWSCWICLSVSHSCSTKKSVSFLEQLFAL